MGVNEIDFANLSAAKGLSRGLQAGAQLGNMYRQNRLQDSELERRDAQEAQDAELKENQRIIDDMARDAVVARDIADPKQRQSFLERRAAKLTQMGKDPSDTLALMKLPFEQQTQELDYVVQKALPVSSIATKNLNGGKWVGTPQRVKEGGKSFLVGVVDDGKGSFREERIAIDGEFISTDGLTAEERVKQRELESGANARGKANEEFSVKAIDQGLSARGLMRDTNRLIELNDLISTGKTAAARKYMGDLFGVTNPDLGEFNSKAGQLVLSQIRMLGANPTEGERAFLEQITPSISQGGAVNEALLKDMLEVQKRQVERGRWFAKNKGATMSEYFLSTDKQDFNPSYFNSKAAGNTPSEAGVDTSLLEFMTDEERALFNN